MTNLLKISIQKKQNLIAHGPHVSLETISNALFQLCFRLFRVVTTVNHILILHNYYIYGPTCNTHLAQYFFAKKLKSYVNELSNFPYSTFLWDNKCYYYVILNRHFVQKEKEQKGDLVGKGQFPYEDPIDTLLGMVFFRT